MTSATVWVLTLVGVGAVIVFDLAVVVRRPHEPAFSESVRWTLFYIASAVVFGFSMLWWRTPGQDGASEFFAGYLTEWSLSVDNLFVFLVILGRFAVPALYRQRVLLFGVVLALVLRGLFIAAGGAALAAFSWVFYLFGAFLLWTAFSVAREGGPDEGEVEYHENRLMRGLRRFTHETDGYRGGAVVVREGGRRMVTPLLLVMIAIGSTDVLFALDSIPAIFGLTQDPYLVFTANAFALMGLRQLFFVVQGLLKRLKYLSYGLSVVLAFIAVKLVLEALHTNSLPFINGGENIEWAPQVPTWMSLAVIVMAIGGAALVSVAATRGSGAPADVSERGN
ncbi:TerC/Alx family metal homeostasis membrane protein [Demequina sp.]|uniref:TerC/Alx family metal homeostasis membrane protein n=1 Tax=Demequina sp. TaxID=2050685 RepID=UPI0025BE67C7|nr:TerC/Alx family metal homeostasis membrane protein [Demequina sp.]